jgi:hypothetical protein
MAHIKPPMILGVVLAEFPFYNPCSAKKSAKLLPKNKGRIENAKRNLPKILPKIGINENATTKYSGKF